MKVETLGRNADSSEEFWYQFDTAGRLNYAAFGLIPLEGEDDYSAELAAYRLISKYEYEPAGRIASVATISQEGEVGLLSGHVESYSKIYDIAANSNEYDAYLGLKTESQTMWWGTSGAFSQGRLQEYSYDALDQLSQCDFYNVNVYGSTSGHTVSNWYYDAAGNRYTNSDKDDHTYTNLNMMTDSPGSLDYDNDVLGNRTWREPETASAVKYVWDSVNRMTQAIGYNGGATYKYRADGMRVKKVGGYSMSWNPPVGETGGFYTEVQVDTNPTYRYFYDGQMCFEDDYLDDEPTYYGTRYGLGARGVDFLQTFGSGGSETGRMFPIYDGHGNMVCTVARNGTSGYYAPKDVKEFGPWGDVRNSANASALPPNKGYCANLGHKLDDESGLVYMRARYYEPSTGRFISEDPNRDGSNWIAYCRNNPACLVDESGHSPIQAFLKFLSSPLFQASVTAVQLLVLFNNARSCSSAAIVAMAGLVFLSGWFADEFAGNGRSGPNQVTMGAIFGLTVLAMADAVRFSALAEAGTSIASKAIKTFANYGIIIGMFLRLEIWEESF